VDELVQERISKTIITPPAERARLAADRAAAFQRASVS
jgi:hypothetical protein